MQALVKRVRSLSEVSAQGLIEDATKLNAGKFLDEVARALAEAKLVKLADVQTAAQLCVFYTARYEEFRQFLVRCFFL